MIYAHYGTMKFDYKLYREKGAYLLALLDVIPLNIYIDFGKQAVTIIGISKHFKDFVNRDYDIVIRILKDYVYEIEIKCQEENYKKVLIKEVPKWMSIVDKTDS